jgi:crotonobetainyl-CoA:carnitine CoA-transferase CaiB-like acyl-CoA transferase
MSASGTRGALEGVRVLDFGSGIAGPFAARILGDLGANVVKVEHAPDGDEARGYEPMVIDRSGRSTSALFELLNWGKRGVALDLDTSAGRERLDALTDWADIVIDGMPGRRLAEWGIDPAAWRAHRPYLVVASVSEFGRFGPYSGWRGSDLILQAMGGVMQISGTTDREPLKPGLRQSYWCAGLNVAYAALAAHHGARRTGVGARLDVSVLECVASQLVMNSPYYAFVGAIQGRRPHLQDPLGGDPLPTADGYVSIQINTFTPVARLAELFEDERLRRQEFATAPGRIRNAEALRAILHEHLSGEKGRDFFVRACEQGFLCGFVQGTSDLLTCPQLESRRAFQEFEDLSVAGAPLRFPAILAELSATPMQSGSRAPRLGEHTNAVFAEFARQSSRALGAAVLPVGRTEPRGPLSGLRVIDLSTVFAVPYIGGLLADLGAEVIKVEAPGRLDQTREGFGACFENETDGDYWNRATTFQSLNRGKRSVSIDLATEEGRDLLRALVKECDVLLDNFTPRVMRKWGTTYAQLKELNPSLVMLSNTGYGSTGPWAAFKAQGTTLEATMGLTHYTGYPRGAPSKAGQSYPDFLAAWTGLVMIMAALLHREATGEGQWIDLGMYQLGAMVIPETLLHVQVHGRDLPRLGNRDLYTVLSGLFPARGDDRWVAISVPDRETLAALASVIDGVSEAMAAGDDMALALPVIEVAIANWTCERDPAEAAALLQRAGVPAGPLENARDLLLDKHLLTRQFYEVADYGPELGLRPLIGRPFAWESRTTEVGIAGPAPAFAEANDYVLRELLELEDDDVAALRAKGIVVDAPLTAHPAHPQDLELLLATRQLVSVDSDYRDILTAVTGATNRFGEPVQEGVVSL